MGGCVSHGHPVYTAVAMFAELRRTHMIAVSNTTLANELLLAIRVPLQTCRVGRTALFIVAANRCIRNTPSGELPQQINVPTKALSILTMESPRTPKCWTLGKTLQNGPGLGCLNAHVFVSSNNDECLLVPQQENQIHTTMSDCKPYHSKIIIITVRGGDSDLGCIAIFLTSLWGHALS